MNDPLQYYIRLIRQLRTDSGKRKYPEATQHRAPHKPILLLCIIDLFDQGSITTNFVPISSQLADLFGSYWEIVMPSDRPGRLFLPLFHMKNDDFWYLIPQSGKEVALNAIQQIGGGAQLRELVLGGKFDDAFYALLCVKETRDMLRGVIIEKYFSASMQAILFERANTNLVAHQYSLELLAKARKQDSGAVQDKDETQRPVRDQGFRIAIVTAYDHRCVLCGVRLMTYEGRTAATAAHIIPWSVGHNDDPRNGLCLCRLCHWTFDVGLATITPTYRIRLSSQLNAEGNMSGYLSTLNDRPIFEPVEQVFNPDIDALKWHTDQVFLR